MQTLATLASFASGLVVMGYPMSAAAMLATSLAIDAALAPVTATIAARRGRSAALWTAMGFLFGAWALAVALLMKPRKDPEPAAPEPTPPPSEAA